MKTSIEIVKISENKYRFGVEFYNDEKNEFKLPASRLERSWRRVGLRISENGKVLEPVRFSISSSFLDNDEIKILGYGQAFMLEDEVEVEKINDDKVLLKISNIHYLLKRDVQYEIYFSLEGLRSDVCYLCF